MKRKRSGGATGRLPSFTRRYPTSLKGARASDATIHAHVSSASKTQISEFSFLPSLRSCTVGNAEDVRLRFYRQFRLCFTTTDFGGRKGIGLSPYPYAVCDTSFDCERNITTVLAPSYHISLARYITLIRKDLNYLENQNDTKSSIIAFRVTPEERAWIEKHSYGNYRIISDFVRDCIFEKDIVIIKGLDEFSNELRRIGNNLNQLTRAVNAGYVRAVDLTETKEEVEKLWQSLNSLLHDAP